MTLKAQIDDYNLAKIAKVPSDILALMDATTEDLIAQHIEFNALKLNQSINDFTLNNHLNEPVTLSTLLEQGPVIISFYRGGWCPYCNLELKALNEMLPEFKAVNAQLIAISPQLPDASLSTFEKNELAFNVLSDTSNKVARQLGLVFTLDERLKPIYAQFGLDIPAANGDNSYQLPLPATYIINQKGNVIYAFVNSDYTLRAEPCAILNALQQDC